MDAGGLKAVFEQRNEFDCRGQTVPVSTITFGVGDKVRIAYIKTKICKAQMSLFPFNHTVSVIRENEDNQV